MKIVFFYLPALVLLTACARNDRQHLGTWKGTEDGDTLILTFQEDGFAVFELEGMTFGGKEFEAYGQKLSMPYTIDYTRNPPTFIIEMKNLETGTVESKRGGTITFEDNNTASICMKPFYENEPPVTFEEKDCLLFTKTD